MSWQISIESRLIKFHESKSLIKPVKLTQNLKIKLYLQKYVRDHYSLLKTKIPLTLLGFLHLLSQFTIILMTLRVCVVGEILRMMENGREKSEEKIVFVGIWLVRRDKRKLVGSGCFLIGPTKMLSPQFGEKIKEWGEKCNCSQMTKLPLLLMCQLFLRCFSFS